MKHLHDAKFCIAHQYALPFRSCPVCGTPMDPRVAQVTTFEQPASAAAVRRGDIGWDEVTGPYYAVSACSSCGESVCAAGIHAISPDVEEDEDGVFHHVFSTHYYPRWLSHLVWLVALPHGTPLQISAAIERASRLFWVDTGACATALRAAIEVFLDVEGVPRSQVDGSGRSISLERRIDAFVSGVEEQAGELEAERFENLLRAVKHIGNEATHQTKLPRGGEIEMLSRMLERVFEMRYAGRPDVYDVARQIVASGPPSPRQRRRARATPESTSVVPEIVNDQDVTRDGSASSMPTRRKKKGT